MLVTYGAHDCARRSVMHAGQATAMQVTSRNSGISRSLQTATVVCNVEGRTNHGGSSMPGRPQQWTSHPKTPTPRAAYSHSPAGLTLAPGAQSNMLGRRLSCRSRHVGISEKAQADDCDAGHRVTWSGVTSCVHQGGSAHRIERSKCGHVECDFRRPCCGPPAAVGSQVPPPALPAARPVPVFGNCNSSTSTEGRAARIVACRKPSWPPEGVYSIGQVRESSCRLAAGGIIIIHLGADPARGGQHAKVRVAQRHAISIHHVVRLGRARHAREHVL
jgi:hypothetical protein